MLEVAFEEKDAFFMEFFRRQMSLNISQTVLVEKDSIYQY